MSAGGGVIVDLERAPRATSRRAALENELRRVEAKLEKYGPDTIGLRRQRYFYYVRQRTRLLAELGQLELPL